MSGIGKLNTTHTPTITEYGLGGGKVYIADMETSGKAKGFRELGNCPSFTISNTAETYEHDDVRGTAPVQDLSTVIRAGSDVAFTLENLSADNLALHNFGTSEVYTNPAISSQTATTMIADGSIEAYKTYQVVDSDGDPAFGLTSTNSLVLKTTNATPVTLVLNTDYTLDADFGLVTLKNSTAITTAISGSEGITCEWSADSSATTVDQVIGLNSTQQVKALMFIANNAINDLGQRVQIIFHNVSIAPDGESQWITQETTSLPMTAKVQTNSFYDAPYNIYTPTTQVGV